MPKPKLPETGKSRKAGTEGADEMRAFLESRGDLRAVFDQVHRHFFDQLTWPDAPVPRAADKKPQ